jgi:glycosyltransferase involved in cell wall biosynthesis
MKIRFCSPIRSHSGYAELGRILVNQCLRAGHQVGVHEIHVQSSQQDFGPLANQALALLDPMPGAEINVVNMIPPHFERFRLPGAKNIGCTMFESDRLPAAWVASCNAMDAIWVPAQWVREVFIASGVSVPVSVVGVDAVAGDYQPPPAEGLFRLVSVFEWSERKNPIGLLRAWFAAFDGDEGAALTLKVHRHPDPKQTLDFVQAAVAAVAAAIKPARRLPRVDIAPHLLSAAQMGQLHQRSHAYLSLAHSEGWGLPPWEATLAGRPVIHTAWSAPVEFVHPQGLVACNLAPVYGMNEFVSFYEAGMNWADPHLDDAIEKLRALRRDYPAWLETARAHRDTVLQRYSLEARIAQLQAALAA